MPDRRDRPYDTAVLDAHVELLANSSFNTHVINPNGQVPWYPSKRLDHVLTGYLHALETGSESRGYQ